MRIFIGYKTRNILSPFFFRANGTFSRRRRRRKVVRRRRTDLRSTFCQRNTNPGNIPGIRSSNRPTGFPGKTTPLRPFRRRLIRWKSIFHSRSYLNGTRDSERPRELFLSMRRTSFRYGSHVKCRENNARFHCRLS